MPDPESFRQLKGLPLFDATIFAPENKPAQIKGTIRKEARCIIPTDNGPAWVTLREKCQASQLINEKFNRLPAFLTLEDVVVRNRYLHDYTLPQFTKLGAFKVDFRKARKGKELVY